MKLEDKLISQMDFSLIKRNGYYIFTNFKSFFCIRLFLKYVKQQEIDKGAVEQTKEHITIIRMNGNVIKYWIEIYSMNSDMPKHFIHLIKRYTGESLNFIEKKCHGGNDIYWRFPIENFSDTYRYRN